MKSKIGRIFIFFLIPLIFYSSDTFSDTPKVSIRLFASINVNKIEVEIPAGPGYQISTDNGSSFDMDASKSAQIIQKDGCLEFSIGERTIKVQKITISQKRESSSYILLSTDKTDKRLYSGNVIISVPRSDNVIRIINICNIEELVNQTILSEFSSLDNPEALIAVSVVIRTYLLYHRGRHKNEGFDYCDTTHCQSFKGWNNQNVSYVESVRILIEKLVSPARHILLTFNGHIVEGYYSACCGGKLATPEIIWGGKSDFPYRNAKSPFCSESKFYRWQREMGKQEFASIFGLADISLKIEVIRNDEDKDFVKNVIVSDNEHKYMLNVGDFRRKIADKAGWNKILSHSFWVKQTQDKIIFIGNGFGHSIGLCEACAYEMGRRGYSWRNILDFFYFQAELTPSDRIIIKSKIE